MRTLPAELAQSYQDFFDAAESLQKQILKSDGLPEDYFQNTSEVRAMPLDVQQRASELDQFNLASEIEAFVSELEGAYEIRDQDLEVLVELCRSERDCIEKSVKTWIDANHLLTEAQISFLIDSMK